MVLTSSGCASGCASDHLPHAKSVTNLGRSVPSLHWTSLRPGYTQLSHHQTVPHIRTVSGQLIREGGKCVTYVDGHTDGIT